MYIIYMLVMSNWTVIQYEVHFSSPSVFSFTNVQDFIIFAVEN